MATLDLTTARQAVNMTNGDLVRFDSIDFRTAAQWSWITPAGHDLQLVGTGLSYDGAGRALSGTITSIEFNLGDNGFTAPDIVIRGINAGARLLDDGPGGFWSFLSGDDTFLGPLIGNGGEGFSRLFGDAAIVHGFGGVAKVLGGNDKIAAEDGSSAQLSGDVGTVVQDALITGGNDTIGGSGRGEAVTGGVFTMLGGSGVEITGGGDTLNGKGGNDVISGDVHVSRSGGIVTGGDDTINGGDDADRIFGEIATGDGTSIGGNGQLFGDAGDDDIKGQSGNDILDGGADNDLLDGGIGNDTVFVSSGNDSAAGAAGIDTLRFSNLGVGVRVDMLNGSASLNNAAGDLLTFREFEQVIGTAGGDTILGGNQANSLLAGGSGNDVINGRAGKDTITGGAGADRMVGGEDADTFDFNAVTESGIASNTRDVIFDFEKGSDKIDVSNIDAIAGGANNAFTFIGAAAFTAAGQVRAIQTGAHTVLEFNTDGAGGADFAIVLANFAATALTQGDFIA